MILSLRDETALPSSVFLQLIVDDDSWLSLTFHVMVGLVHMGFFALLHMVGPFDNALDY